jgi:lactate dehydrogenase-like 2-hydroxyacid dehydrogenase
MKKRVVAYRRLPAAAVELLEARCDLRIADANRERAAFLDALASAHGIIGNKLRITPALLDAEPLLETAATISAGYDDFDVPDLTRRGIVLTSTPAEVTETTAGLVFGLMRATARRIAELDAWTRHGQWRASSGPAQFGVDVITRRSALSGSAGSAPRSHGARPWASACRCSIRTGRAMPRRKALMMHRRAPCPICLRKRTLSACSCRSRM